MKSVIKYEKTKNEYRIINANDKGIRVTNEDELRFGQLLKIFGRK
jgi:hypothetical protein